MPLVCTAPLNLDLLQQYAKKQNDEVARAKAATVKEAISEYVQKGRSSEARWESREQREARQEKAGAKVAKLEPFLKMRFKLYVPRRRPM